MGYKDPEKKKEYARIYYQNNKEKCDKQKRKYWEKNKEQINLDVKQRYKEKYRWREIKNKYGITKEDWENIYREQNGECFICGRTEKELKRIGRYGLVVDHDHITGKVRGLLCDSCNRILGLINDDIYIIDKMRQYLKNSWNEVPQEFRYISKYYED